MVARAKQRRGGATVYVLIVLAVMSTVLTGVIVFVVAQMRASLHEVQRAEALHAAEAGVYFYLWYLAHETDGRSRAQIDAFWSSPDTYGVAQPFERRVGEGMFRIEVAPPDPGQTAVTITVTGWRVRAPHVKRTVRVRLRRPSWSEYAALINADVRFGNGTVTRGPVQSNGGVRFDGVAHNVVRSARVTYTDPDTGRTRPGVWTQWPNAYNASMGSNVFRVGTDFPVPAVDFTGVMADFSLMRDRARATGHYYDVTNGVGAAIVLQSTQYTIRTVTRYDRTSGAIIAQGAPVTRPLPDNGVIYVRGHVWVEGVIADRIVTIVAADDGPLAPNIFIGNNITYAAYDGSAILGLAAENDIEIIRDSAAQLRIDAALLAQGGRVGRRHYGRYCTTWWWIFCVRYAVDRKDTITINGAIASNKRYGFAWTDGTGYATRTLLYDNSLLYTPPPYFPTGSHYVPDLWEEL